MTGNERSTNTPDSHAKQGVPSSTGELPFNTSNCDDGRVSTGPKSQSLSNLTKQALPTSPEKIRERGDVTEVARSIRGSDLASYAPPLSNDPLSLCDLNLLCQWLLHDVAAEGKPSDRVAAVKLIVETNQVDKKGKAGRVKRGELGDALAAAVLKASAESKAARALEVDDPLPDEPVIDV